MSEATPVTPFTATRHETITFDAAPVPAPGGWPEPLAEAVRTGRITHRRALGIMAQSR